MYTEIQVAGEGKGTQGTLFETAKYYLWVRVYFLGKVPRPLTQGRVSAYRGLLCDSKAEEN